MSAASIVVTHQFSTIRRTDRLILLHQGKIMWSGTSKELYNSDNPYAQQFAEARLDGPMALEQK
jgi:phospholipid/cholesterol/gamma-HCH transport system ATP-binding protein